MAGCDDAPAPDLPAPSVSSTAAPDADADLVDDLIGKIVATAPVVASARRQHRELRQPLRPFVELHRHHLAALDFPEDTKFANTSASVGLAEVRRAEVTLQRHLTEAAVQAESGALAQLLASMAAAVAQHLAVLR